MDPFYQNIGSFPTIVFTIALAVCVIYWLGAVLGIVDLDIIDIDIDGVSDLNADSPHSTPDALAGLMLRFGLTGVPFPIIVSLISLVGWMICYYAVHFIFALVPGGFLRYLIGLPILLVSIYLAVMITAQLIKPLRPFFQKATQQHEKQVLGQTAVVRTSRVDNDFGEAVLEDGGAGLILKVRSAGDDRFAKGDRVVIFEKMGDDTIYRVISEAEFNGL